MAQPLMSHVCPTSTTIFTPSIAEDQLRAFRLQLPVPLWSISYHSVSYTILSFSLTSDDLTTSVAKVPAWFPGAGFERMACERRESLEEMVSALHEFVKDQMIAGIALVSAEEEHVVKWSVLSLYAGGSDTVEPLPGVTRHSKPFKCSIKPRSATALGPVEQDANY
ncbi:hypothetical protein BDR06DRAFT_1011225 [Suillus hirtellus]|nr:hypothetical protein BDR06DRAFT_1011225 [Suillus hirtellus]